MTDEELEATLTALMMTHDISANPLVTTHRVVELCHERADTVRDLWRLLCELYVAKDWTLPVEYVVEIIEGQHHKLTTYEVLDFVDAHAVKKKREPASKGAFTTQDTP